MVDALLDLPARILDVCSFLDGIGLPAWLVGGCLRDLLLGHIPEDWDFATPFTPERVRQKLTEGGASIWDTGIRHGTLTFRYRSGAYEITTFRRDGPYEDFRRPKWVEYTDSLTEDLARRDFTINAMAYHWKDGLSDPFGGMADMENSLIRAVGSPGDRIQEDALRILRAVRFAGSLDFALDEELCTEMAAKAELLQWISQERLASELQRMLIQPSPKRAMMLMAELGLWPYVIPEITETIGFHQQSDHHILTVYEHLVETTTNVPAQLDLRLAALLHDIAKPGVHYADKAGKNHYPHHETVSGDIAAGIMDRLHFSHKLRAQVQTLIQHHMLHLKTLDDSELRTIISGLPKPRDMVLEQILQLQKADLLASKYTDDSFDAYEDFARRSKEILASGCPLDLADLALKGGELEALGIAPADRNHALKAMLTEVLTDPRLNTREALLEIALSYVSQNGLATEASGS